METKTPTCWLREGRAELNCELYTFLPKSCNSFFCPPLLKISKINLATFLKHLQKLNHAQRWRRFKMEDWFHLPLSHLNGSKLILFLFFWFFFLTQYRKTSSPLFFSSVLTVWEYYLYKPISNSLLNIESLYISWERNFLNLCPIKYSRTVFIIKTRKYVNAYLLIPFHLNCFSTKGEEYPHGFLAFKKSIQILL